MGRFDLPVSKRRDRNGTNVDRKPSKKIISERIDGDFELLSGHKESKIQR